MLLKILKKTICRTCYAYTAVVLVYLLIMLELFQKTANPYPLTLIMLFPFCFLFTFANCIVGETKLSGGYKLLTHFLIVTLDIILLIWLPYGSGMSSSTALILFAAYLLLYAVGAFVFIQIITAKRKKLEAQTEYKGVYTSLKRK